MGKNPAQPDNLTLIRKNSQYARGTVFRFTVSYNLSAVVAKIAQQLLGHDGGRGSEVCR